MMNETEHENEEQETQTHDEGQAQQDRAILLLCPKCGALRGRLSHERQGGERPEGLTHGGTTLVQCESCYAEWETVTRSQMLRSMRGWTAGLVSPR